MLSKHGKVFDFISDYLIFALASLNISLSLLFSLFALESELLFFILPSIIYTILLFPIIYFISKNKNSILIFILALILIFIGMSMLAGPGLYSWLRGYVFRVSSVNLFYSQITIFLLNLIICSLIYFSFFKLKSFLPFVLIGGSIFVAQSEIMNIHWSKILFYSYIFLVLIIIFYISSKKNVLSVEKGEKSCYVAFFIPACILLCLVFFFIPKQQKALIDEKDSKDFFENIVVAVNIIVDMFQDEGRSFSYGGSNFGLNESFLGGVSLSDEGIALKVRSNRNFYLRGRTYSEYTGNSWKTESFESDESPFNIKRNEDENSKDFELEIVFPDDMFFSLQEKVRDVSNRTNAEINFVTSYTSTIFAPNKPIKINVKNQNLDLYIDGDYNISAQKNNRKGFLYSISFYDYENGSEEFIQLLLESENSEETLYSYVLQTYNSLNIKANRSETQAIAESYTALPDTISKRVKNLAQRLQNGLFTRYEKVKAIEEYLKTSFEYTKLVPDTPPNQDFVDYFLFDLQKGYCTYYATAMTVLCREMGIPARYVEGYVVPKQSDDGYRYVTNNLAHAWAEVFFDGIGFVAFEPTPVFNEGFYYVENKNTGNNMQNNTGEYKPEEIITEPEEELDIVNEEDSKNIIIILASIISAPFIVLICGYLINILWIKRKLKQFTKIKTIVSIKMLYKFYLKGFSYMGLKRLESETVSEFSARLYNIIDISDLSKSFSDAFYGNKPPEHIEIYNAVKLYPKILELSKKRFNPLKYFIFRIRWNFLF